MPGKLLPNVQDDIIVTPYRSSYGGHNVWRPVLPVVAQEHAWFHDSQANMNIPAIATVVLFWKIGWQRHRLLFRI